MAQNMVEELAVSFENITLAGDEGWSEPPRTTRNKKRSKKKAPTVVELWDSYFGEGDLADWQRLMRDLGLNGDFSSKTKCRKALDRVWVNIVDFLDCKTRPKGLQLFSSERDLAAYTQVTRKIYPKDRIPKDSPLRKLLAHVLR